MFLAARVSLTREMGVIKNIANVFDNHMNTKRTQREIKLFRRPPCHLNPLTLPIERMVQRKKTGE